MDDNMITDMSIAVIVDFSDGEWRVRVTENGETAEKSFDLEAHASAFADGQRIRLGIYRRSPG